MCRGAAVVIFVVYQQQGYCHQDITEKTRKRSGQYAFVNIVTKNDVGLFQETWIKLLFKHG